MSENQNCLHGIAAEFENAEELVAAVERAKEAGYSNIRAYSPYYVEELDEAIDDGPNFLPWLVVGGLFIGALVGYFLQYYASVEGYAINVGGRPLNSAPAFMLVTFELGVLFAALGGATGFLLGIGLPLPYHPIFNTPNIELATRNRFFLCIETRDRRFHLERTRAFLEGLEPVSVSEVSC